MRALVRQPRLILMLIHQIEIKLIEVQRSPSTLPFFYFLRLYLAFNIIVSFELALYIFFE